MGGAPSVSVANQITDCEGNDFFFGHELGGKRSELDHNVVGFDRRHGRQHVRTGVTFDKRLDGKFDMQHNCIVLPQGAPITRRSSLARNKQSRPAESNASPKRVRASRNEVCHSCSKT